MKFPLKRQLLLAILALLCLGGAVAACGDAGREPVGSDPFAQGGAKFYTGTSCGGYKQPPCQIEGITVVAPPAEECNPERDVTCETDPCTLDPTSYDCMADPCKTDPNSCNTTPTPTEPEDCESNPYLDGCVPEGNEPPPPGEEREPCARDEKNNCIGMPLSSEQWATLQNTIARIRDYPDYCAGAKAKLQELAAQGPDRFAVWSGFWVEDWDKDGKNDAQYFGAINSDGQGYKVEFDPQELGSVITVVHEGLHLYRNASVATTGKLPGDESWIKSVQANCR